MNELKEKEIPGVYEINMTFPAYSEDQEWLNRFKVLRLDDVTYLNPWAGSLCLGTDVYGDNQTSFRVENQTELEATIYLQPETGAVVIRDQEGNDVPYRFSWVGFDGESPYTTVEEFATSEIEWPSDKVWTEIPYDLADKVEELNAVLNGDDVDVSTSYRISKDGSVITGYRGEPKEIVIPEGVKEIKANAFKNCYSLEKIELPESLEKIGEDAFFNCYKLNTVNVAAQNKVFYSEDGVLYTNNGGEKNLYLYPSGKRAEEFSIPQDVTGISGLAFNNCLYLKKLNIPAAVNDIKEDAFTGVRKLEEINVAEGNENFSSQDSVLFDKDKESLWLYPSAKAADSYTVPKSTKNIGQGAFTRCRNLEKIVMPANLIHVEGTGISSCTNLKEIVFSNGIKELNGYFIDNGDTVERIKIPESVESIDNSFLETFSNAQLTVAENNQVYKAVEGVLYSKDGKKLIYYPRYKQDTVYEVAEGTEVIGANAFARCYALTEVTLPASVTEIQEQAFYACMNLNQVSMPDTVKLIGQGAFQASGINSLKLSEGLEDIGEYAFGECFSLKEVVIPDSVKSIGALAFANCYQLNKVVIPAGVEEIGEGILDGSNAEIYCNRDSVAEQYALENGFQYVILEDIVNLKSDNGFEVVGVKSGIPEGSELRVQSLKEGDASYDGIVEDIQEYGSLDADIDFVMYDISITDAMGNLQEAGEVTINIPVPEQFASTGCDIYELVNNKLKKVKSNQQDTIAISRYADQKKLTYLLAGSGVEIPGKELSENDVQDGRVYYTLAGGVTSWEPLSRKNIMNATEFEGVYAKTIKVNPFDEESEWNNRFRILKIDDISVENGWWHQLCLGTRVFDDNQTMFRIENDEEMMVTVYFDTTTGAVLILDEENQVVNYRFSWVGYADETQYVTADEYADYGWSADSLKVSELPDIVKRQNILYKKLMGTLTEEELKDIDEDDNPVVDNGNELVTFHFYNKENWDTVGAWIFEGLAWERNALLTEQCVLNDKGYPIFPGARMIPEGGGWYKVTCSFENLQGKGAVMLFNNYVGDAVENITTSEADIQKLRDAGITLSDTAVKIQTPNIMILRNAVKSSAYYLEWDGNARESVIVLGKSESLTAQPPQSYIDMMYEKLGYSNRQAVTYHFYNAGDWEDVGVWVKEGIAWEYDVLPPEKCVLKENEKGLSFEPIYPGAKMEEEGNGWYKITCYYDDFSLGSMMIFNNYVGDSQPGDTTTYDNLQKVKAAGIKQSDQYEKIQTPNVMIKKNTVPSSDYYINWDGDTKGSMIVFGKSDMITDVAPSAYTELFNPDNPDEPIEPEKPDEPTEPDEPDAPINPVEEEKEIYQEVVSDDGIQLTFEKDSIEEDVSFVTKVMEKDTDDEAVIQEIEEVKNVIENAVVDYTKEVTDIKYEVYDISLTNTKEEKVQPDKEVTVKVPIPFGYNGKGCRIYRLEKNGELTNMKAELVDGMLQFTTEHFSIYVITEDEMISKDKWIYGDANGDGVVNSADMVLIKQYMAGYKVEIDEFACDVDGNDKVAAADAVKLLKKMAGYKVAFGG